MEEKILINYFLDREIHDLHYNLGHYVNNDKKSKLIFMFQTYSNDLLLKSGTTEVLDDDVAENLRRNAKG